MNDTPAPAGYRDSGSTRRVRLPALLRRIEPPRTADGRPDYRLPAMALASCTGIAALFLGFYLALYSRLWHDHQHLAAAAVAGAALPALLAYVLSRHLLARTGLYLWQSLLASAVLLFVMGSTPTWARTIFPPAYDRYEAELGGPGQCLHNTPYNLDRAQTTFAEHRPDRMIVRPIRHGLPSLALDNAVDGGLQHLAPADAASRRILTTYGC
ncbi:hypothetical protein [Streptomyces sp. bgisy153]|uniref:hypothetical protein n=1 Tax=Streptomyces sp. bgisy153 TaxID=3413793 RepID=UPI003D740FC4